ncbi:MAG: hypothetical protein R2800_07155 [Flavipsychrobacter sp.]
MKKIFTIAIAGVILSACNGAEKLTDNNKTKATKKKVACADMPVGVGKEHLDWVKEKQSVLYDDTKVVVLPKVYKVYTLSKEQLNAFFLAVKNNKTTQPLETVVPLPYGCIVFPVEQRKDVSPKMLKMYPNTILAKGEKDGYELNLSFDGTKMSGQIRSATQQYDIMPMEANGNFYYVVYEKAQEMEANKEGVYKETPKMKSHKIRYDR